MQGESRYKSKIDLLKIQGGRNMLEPQNQTSTLKVYLVLTLWRRQEGKGQDEEVSQLRERHSLPEDGRGRDKLVHRKKATEQGALTD